MTRWTDPLEDSAPEPTQQDRWTTPETQERWAAPVDEPRSQMGPPAPEPGFFEGIKKIKAPEGAGSLELSKVGDRLYKRALDLGQEILKPLTERVKAFEEDGLVGLAKRNIKDIPLAGEALEVWEHRDDLDTFAKDRVAKSFGVSTFDKLSKRSPVTNISTAITEATRRALVRGDTSLPDAVVGSGAGAVSKAVVGVARRAGADFTLTAEDVARRVPTDLGGRDLQKIAQGFYELQTGRRWVDDEELARLRVKDPRKWGKANKAQMATVFAVGNGLTELAQGMGSLALTNTGLADANLLKLMAGTAANDLMDSFEDPETRLFEDPLGFAMDVNPIGAVGAGAKVGAAAKLAKTSKGLKDFAHAAAVGVGLPGPIAFTRLIPGAKKAIPSGFQRGEFVSDLAKSQAYTDALGSFLKASPLARSLVSTAPDEAPSVVAHAQRARQQKAAAQAKINRVAKELADDLDVGVRPLLRVPKAEPARSPTAKKYQAYVDNLEHSDEALGAFVNLHEAALRKIDAGKIDAEAGRPVDIQGLAIAHALNDPRKLMALAQDPEVVQTLGRGFGTQKRLEDLITQVQVWRSKDPAKFAVEIRKGFDQSRRKFGRTWRDLAAKKDFDGVRLSKERFETFKNKVESVERVFKKGHPRQGLENVEAELAQVKAFRAGLAKFDDLLAGESGLKSHGAWLELDGQALGGVNATMRVMKLKKQGMNVDDIFNQIKIGGDDTRMRGVMERAKEIAQIAAHQDERLVHHGIITQGQATGDFAARFNHIRTPQRAADFDIAAVALNPHARLEQGQIVRDLDYFEDLAGQIKVASPESVIGSGRRTKSGGRDLVSGDVDGVRFVQMPNEKVEVAGHKVPAFGVLNGKWISQDAADLLFNMANAKRTWLQKLVQPWIKTKVINNSKSHVNAVAGEAITSLAAGVNPVTAWPRAVRMMRGGGTEAQKLLAKHAFEEAGVYDAAAIRSMDELAGLDTGGLKDIKGLFRALRKADRLEDAGLSEAVADLGVAGWRLWHDKVQGLGGVTEFAWGARDKMVRLALFEEGVHRSALHRLGYTSKDLKKPANMARALANPQVVNHALSKAVDFALDYRSLPRGPRVIPRGIPGIGGRGLYQATKDLGVLPFIAYPLKAGGLWTKEFFANPSTSQLIKVNSRVNWEMLEEEERTRRLANERPGDRGWKVHYGDSALNTKFIQPATSLPVELAAEFERNKGPFSLMPFYESLTGRTADGQKIKNPAGYLVQKLLLTSTQEKIVGNNKPGLIELLRGDSDALLDPLTKKPYNRAEQFGRLFLSLEPDQKLRAGLKLQRSYDRYARELAKNQKQRDMGRGGWSATQLARANAKARKQMLEETGALARFNEPR